MTAPAHSREVRVTDQSGVGEARRAARRSARELGLDDVATEQAAIVAVEASRNALLHGGGGSLLVSPTRDLDGLDLVALDRGPGIDDLRRALADGYSTGGTAGQGLGAISRLATRFDVYSAPGKGTALFARIGGAADAESLEVGSVCVPLATETECGDAWAIAGPPGAPTLLVVDGLGHGHHAAEAAAEAVAAFRQHAALPVERLLEVIHGALRATRGAAIAVAQAGAGAIVRYAGIGNISGVMHGSGHVRKMVSLPGTAGHEARTIRCFEYEWPADGLLVLHSDGVGSRWDLAEYPGLSTRHPALIAGVLHRDFSRGRDDATVVVVRRAPP
jgi:anti-sigma regulatory factor (Ser/Thr protein kinase)